MNYSPHNQPYLQFTLSLMVWIDPGKGYAFSPILLFQLEPVGSKWVATNWWLPCMHASTHPYIHTSMHPLIHPTTHPCIHPCIHASMHSWMHASIYLSMHASILTHSAALTSRKMWNLHDKMYAWDPVRNLGIFCVISAFHTTNVLQNEKYNRKVQTLQTYTLICSVWHDMVNYPADKLNVFTKIRLG